jgi:hypothetical protein
VLYCRFYAGTLRAVLGALRRNDFLRDVQTLILDGLSVTSELVHDIITDPSYNVRVLSLRDVRNMNYGKLRGTLQYACRPTRPAGTPRLKALYVFGSKYPPQYAPAPSRRRVPAMGEPGDSDEPESEEDDFDPLSAAFPVIDDGKSDEWWTRKGRIITRPHVGDWVSCLQACEGVIAFDGVLCRGPRHRSSPAFGKCNIIHDQPENVATFAVPACESCGEAPEGLIRADTRPLVSLPCLYPPPIMSSSLQACVMPEDSSASFSPRCDDCLRERYCTTCHKWWCENCFMQPGQSGPQILDTVEEESWNFGLNPSEGSESGSIISTTKSKVRRGLCEVCADRKQSTTYKRGR